MRNLSTLITLFIFMALTAAHAEWTSYTQNTSPLETNYISAIDVCPDGKVLVSSNGRGLYTIDGATWDGFNEDSTGVPINYAYVACFSGDTLFIGSASGNLDTQPLGEGLSYMNPVDSTWAEANSGLQISPIITGIVCLENRRIVATYGGGLTIFNDIGWIRYQTDFRTEFTYADSQQQTYKVSPGTYLPTDYIKGIDYDRVSNVLWIATLNGGAVAYDGTSWTIFNANNSSLPSNRIQVIKTNPVTGSVYFGTYGFGLAEKSGDSWQTYNTSNSGLLSNYIYSLECRPDSNHLWIGTGYAVNILQDDGVWQAYLPADSGLVWGDFYSGIAFDSSGNAWVSTFGGGISFKKVAYPIVEPEYDSLYVDVKNLKLFLREPRRHDLVWLRANLEPEVDLVDSSIVSASLTTVYGDVYTWEASFEQFQRIWNWGNKTIYLAYIDDSMMMLTYQHRQDRIKLYMFDWQPEIDHDNLNSQLDLRIQLGSYVSHNVIGVGQADPSSDPDADTVDYDQQDMLLSSDYFPFITDIEDGDPETPAMISLPHNYPNPFNANTTISFGIDRSADVSFVVYDILGRVMTEKSEYLNAGEHSIDWHGDNNASGVYYYVIRFDDQILKGNMTLLK